MTSRFVRSTLSLMGVLATIGSPAIVRAAESWADPKLNVRDRLVMWLDASRQPDAAQAKDGAKAERWLDASGNHLDLAAPAEANRPTFRTGEKDGKWPPAFYFDGRDDAVVLSTDRKPLKNATVVVVAAAQSVHPGFTALFSASAAGKNDYRTGLNVDLGPNGSLRWDVLNVEGAGAGGMANLLDGHPSLLGFEMNTYHAAIVTVADGPGGIALRVDGKPGGKRDREPGSLMSIEKLAIGARQYSNDPNRPPYLSGFFDGRIAEVLLYDRVLSEAELARLDAYLTEKYPVLKEAARTIPPPPGSRPLELVKDPPAIQTFVPGFTVKRLPLDLTNINNLRYRPDGKLVALAYDGNVYLLSDTDGDGLEDKAELFWDNQGRIQSPIGMALTPPGYARGDGLFIACKGKLSLVVDTDKDGKADKEIVVATGWPLMFHQVDALGVAIDPKDGSIYFGLGTTNFAEPFLIDKDGKAHYDIKGERGTIQRVSADFSKRETVCTGVRFSVGMAFNAAGDLFCTDQEGATWVPNGNPFDELLHIQPGRHYGFPARHPKHLPNVIDEPSTFDYGPQHQSICGLVFNEPVNGGPVFGPDAWRGDAIVTGYSRAKLYRTKLVKTPTDYVAESQLLAGGTMMFADACVTPTGDLAVCAHGGRPDWGNGPAGKGAMFKIFYADRAKPSPQPTLVYAAGPREVRVAFDRPLDPAALHGLASKASIDFGDAVAAGDRFESVRPGYDAVKRQLVQPRFGLDVHGVAVSPDRRTLILQTSPMSRAVGYGLTLPGMKSSQSPPAAGAIAQVDAVDLAYTLNGVEASFTPDGATAPTWTGWLPHLDLAIANALTQNSPEHDAFRAAIRRAGKLRLRTQLDLDHMLRPRVQPGSQIDFEYPPEKVTVALSGSGALVPKEVGGVPYSDHIGQLSIPFPPLTKPVPIDVELTTFGGDKPVRLEVSYQTNEDQRERPIELRRFILPWATPSAASDAQIASKPKEPQPIPELAGGNWFRGRAVFHSEKAMCAKCHRLRDDGTAKIGPDLSNLHERDYASVLQDVVLPSAAINPDHVAYTITLRDGNVLAGVPRPDGETAYIVGEPGGKETRVERSAVTKMEALPTSIMPHGIDQVLGPAAMKDLMTFLLAPPLEPAKVEIPNPPPARKLSEVEAILGSRSTGVSPVSPAKKKDTGGTPVLRKLRVLLVAGPKDHGIGEHDYPLWQRRWSQLLSRAEDVEVDTAWEWPTAKQFEAADVAVFFSNNAGWSAAPEKAGPFDAFQNRGGGVVLLHYAVNGRGDVDAFATRVGLAWKDGGSRFRHGAEDLAIADKSHPITRGFGDSVHFVDETYWALKGDASKVHVLATSMEDNAPQPQLWTFEPPGAKGRVFGCLLGHYNWTFDDPLARILMLRAIAWCAHEDDVDRLTPLATVGARVAN